MRLALCLAIFVCACGPSAAPAPENPEVAAEPAPPSPQEPSEAVPDMELNGKRLSGETDIVPSPEDRERMLADGHDRVTASVKFCLDPEGVPEDVSISKSSGYAAYDARLVDAVKAWRYEPTVIDGSPVPICTVALFFYEPTPDPSK